MARYKIWDKTSNVVTPIGEVLTAEQWIQRYPIAAQLTTVVADGDINGGFFGVLSQMRRMAEDAGADFSEATTDEQVLQVIEDFEDAQAEAAKNIVTDETRTADALEDLVVLQELSQS